MSQRTAKAKRRAAETKQNGTPTPAKKPGAYKVPGDLAQLIVNYLQTKPYMEVHELIGGLLRCEKMKE